MTHDAWTLYRAASILGGETKLSRFLRVPGSTLSRWMERGDIAPVHVMLDAMDIIALDGALSGAHTDEEPLPARR